MTRPVPNLATTPRAGIRADARRAILRFPGRPGSDAGGALPWILVGLLGVLLLIFVAIAAFLWWSQVPEATRLAPGEEQVLERKLEQLVDGRPAALAERESRRAEPLPDRSAESPEALPDTRPDTRPEAEDERLPVYTADAEARRLTFSEREINALLDRFWSSSNAQPDAAWDAAPVRMRVRLSPDQASLASWFRLPADSPVLAGRVVRFDTGIRLTPGTGDDRPSARLVGLSVAGVPLPRAWLGSLADADLMAPGGILEWLASGAAELGVEDGTLRVQLAE